MGDRRSKPARKQLKGSGNAKKQRTSDHRDKKRRQVRDAAVEAPKDAARRLLDAKSSRMVGLTFQAIGSKKKMLLPGGLKILLAGSGLFMENRPLMPVADADVESEWPFRSAGMRLVYVQDGELSSRQLSLLDEFILYHTMGEA